MSNWKLTNTELPEINKQVLLRIKSFNYILNEETYLIYTGSYCKFCWVSKAIDEDIPIDDVVAWCEIPKYDL